MKKAHKHIWNVDVNGNILHCKVCNKISVTEKEPERKNGCFGTPKYLRGKEREMSNM